MAAVNSFLDSFKEFSTTKLIAIGGATAIILVGLILIFTRSTGDSLAPLYLDLDYKDSSYIMKELDAKNIPYQLRSNGSVILVPRDEALKLRMDFAEDGIPRTGNIIGYEIFDKSETLGTSNFVQNVNLLRALEGELGRSIASFQNIEKARVHLVMPKRELFAREQHKPSASVVLTMKGNRSLSKEQINAITHLISTAVKDLEIANITIVDTQGRSLKLGNNGEEDIAFLASSSQDYKIAYENRLKNVIEELLEESLGAGKVRARVSADINFDRVITNSETFDPDSKVERSVQTVEEKDSTSDKSGSSEVSVATNLPDTKDNSGSGGLSSNSERRDETTNFEISKIIKNHISETGKINKISIAVIVDGFYITDPTTKKVEYKGRSPEELEQIKTIVKSAVGFDEQRKDTIEVANMQFIRDLDSLVDEGFEGWLKDELPSLVQTFVIATVVVLVLLLVVRPIALQAFEMSKVDFNQLDKASEEEVAASLKAQKPEPEVRTVEPGEEPSSRINISYIEEKLKNNSVKSLNDLAQRFPEESLNAIRAWLNADKEKKT